MSRVPAGSSSTRCDRAAPVSAAVALRTERLLLRGWSPEDRDPFAALNADPRVMEFIGPAMARERSDLFADRIEARLAEHGFGLWAVEVPGVAPFVGYVGIAIPSLEAPFMPAIEIGWRLDAAFWGNGYASEAARAALAFAFGTLGLDEIVAFTNVGNVRSRRVMERIGMTYDPESDFEHPSVPAGSPLRPHVLYRIQAPGGLTVGA
jgi:RimJ/RimL family protein N-acetyltransferase